MKLLSFNHVIVLSPHPDDVEYSLSGTIIKNKDTRFSIYNMSQGGDFDRADSEREIESTHFWKNIPNAKIIDTRRSFIKNTSHDEIIYWLETRINENFDAVIAPPQKDFHFEHKTVSEIGRALTRKTSVSFLEYSTPSTSNDWVPNIFIDISDFYEQKVNLLEDFNTQQNRTYFTKECIDSFHTSYFGFKRNPGYYETLRAEFIFFK